MQTEAKIITADETLVGKAVHEACGTGRPSFEDMGTEIAVVQHEPKRIRLVNHSSLWDSFTTRLAGMVLNGLCWLDSRAQQQENAIEAARPFFPIEQAETILVPVDDVPKEKQPELVSNCISLLLSMSPRATILIDTNAIIDLCRDRLHTVLGDYIGQHPGSVRIEYATLCEIKNVANSDKEDAVHAQAALEWLSKKVCVPVTMRINKQKNRRYKDLILKMRQDLHVDETDPVYRNADNDARISALAFDLSQQNHLIMVTSDKTFPVDALLTGSGSFMSFGMRYIGFIEFLRAWEKSREIN